MCCEKNDELRTGYRNDEVDGPRPRGRPEDLERGCGKDYRAQKLNNEDAMDHIR